MLQRTAHCFQKQANLESTTTHTGGMAAQMAHLVQPSCRALAQRVRAVHGGRQFGLRTQSVVCRAQQQQDVLIRRCAEAGLGLVDIQR